MLDVLQEIHDYFGRLGKPASESNYLRMILFTSSAYLFLLLLSLAMHNIAVRYAESDPDLGDLLSDLQGLPVLMYNCFNFGFYYLSGSMFRKAFAKAFAKSTKPN